MKRINFFRLLLFLFIPISGFSQALHVGPGQTYSTIQAAVAALSASEDDTIIVHQNTYYENITIENIGQLGHPSSLTILPASGTDTVLIQNPTTKQNSNFVFNLVNCSNITLLKLEIVNLTGTVLKISGENACDNINVIECSLTGEQTSDEDTTKPVIYITGGSKKIFFQDNAIYNGTYSIFSNATTIDGIIKTNYMQLFSYACANFDNPIRLSVDANTIIGRYHANMQTGIMASGSSTDSRIIKIQNNYIGLEGQTNTALFFYALDTAYIANNMISIIGNNNNFFIDDNSSLLYSVFNNVCLFTEDNYSAILRSRAPRQSHFFQNNIFKIEGDACFWDLDANDVSSDYNLFSYENITNFAKSNGQNYATFEDWKNLYSQDASSITGDPQFYDIYDLHVSNEALIRGKGTHNEFFDRDYDLQKRKWLPDIGADEVNGIVDFVNSDTTWKGIVYIDDTLAIPAPYTLTIEAGTQVIFLGDTTGIASNGTIRAIGTEQEPILFFSKYDNQKWNGISIENSSNNKFEYCSFHNTDNTALILQSTSHDTITHCRFEHTHAEDGGALLFELDSISPIINACYFFDCNANSNGGAILSTTPFTISNSIFIKNSASFGGDIYCDTTVTMMNCLS